MRDLATVLWKEGAEFAGNRRFLRVFLISVLLFGVLPEVGVHKASVAGASGAMVATVLSGIYVLFSGVVVVAQTAPDLVLRERSGRTLDYLLSTRLPDAAIFGGKILMATAVGYGSSLLTVVVQLAASALLVHHAWSWLYLGLPQGRLVVFGVAPLLAAYLSTVGTFVALRVGDQRSAYMVTMLGVLVLALPFLLQLVHLHLNMSWLWKAFGVLAAVAAAVVVAGFRLFRREMLVLYLQE